MDPIQDLLQAAISSGTDQAISGLVAIVKSLIPQVWSHLGHKGRKQVEVNLKNFVGQFTAEIQRLVESDQLTKDQLNAVLDQPDLIDLLMKTLTQAALTNSTEKQILLSKVVAERLNAEPESEFALVSSMACDAISKLNTKHLKVLGLCHVIAMQRYEESDSADGDNSRLREVEWVIHTFAPYQDVEASAHDAEHLEAVGCVGGPKGWLVGDLPSTLKRMVSPDLDLDTLMQTSTGQHLETIWKNASLYGLVLTSVGSLIGLYTADILANRPTDISQWLNRIPK